MIGQVAALRDDAHHHRRAAPATSATARPRSSTAAAVRRDPTRGDHVGSMGIAIVGMAALFPGAADVDQFWANVVGAVDAITEVPAERWNVDALLRPRGGRRRTPATRPRRSGAGSCPTSRSTRCAYGIPPRSLTSIEPSSCSASRWRPRALADAGYADRAVRPRADLGGLRRRDRHRSRPAPTASGPPCRTSSATCPPRSTRHLPDAHRGLVPRRARQRHRRAHRQPARPRRRQLHRRRRLRRLARRASTPPARS